MMTTPACSIGDTKPTRKNRLWTKETATWDKAPPTLILAPESDGLVPSWSVYRFADQARFAGVDVELVRIPFASHVYNQIASRSIGNQARLSITRRYLLERGLGPGARDDCCHQAQPLNET